MARTIDDLFPESDLPDNYLLGLTDCSGGRASEFFGRLDPDERVITQDFLERFISPFSFTGRDVSKYVDNLLLGYINVDPSRTSIFGVQAAVREIQRARQYLGVFLAVKDGFFPWINSYGRLERDSDTGVLADINFMGWGDFRDSQILSFDHIQDCARRSAVPLLEAAEGFMTDGVESIYYNLANLIAANKTRMETETTVDQ